MNRKEKQKSRQRQTTRQLINVKEITDFSLVTYHGDELVFFSVQPTNLSVLSEESLSTRIYALMTVLMGVAELEFICLNSRENFESNKLFLRERLETEYNPNVRALLEADLSHMDHIQVQMATAREFLIVLRLRNQKQREVFPYLNRIEKSLREQGFVTKRAEPENIKRILAVYFGQNVTTEKFENLDGERWMIGNE